MSNKIKNNKIMTLKTLFFAAITAVMVLPFSTMDIADAVSSTTPQTKKMTMGEKILQIEQDVNAIKQQKLDTKNDISKISKYIHSLQYVTLVSLERTYTDALKNGDILEAKQIEKQIDVVIQKITTLESKNYQNILVLEHFDDALVDKWNSKAERISKDFTQKFDEKHASDAEFARAEYSVKAIMNSDSISNVQWSIFFDDLNVMLEKLGYDLVSEENKAELKQLITNEILGNTQTTQISQYLNSQFPPIHFLSASSTSCGTPIITCHTIISQHQTLRLEMA